MENVLKKTVLRQTQPPHPLIVQIREVCAQIDRVQSRFAMETDPDLIEGCIYELGSLRAQYRYLLREARQQQIVCTERAHLWNE